MAVRNLYKPATSDRLTDDSLLSEPAPSGALDEPQRQSKLVLVSNYSPESNSFSSGRQLGASGARSASEPTGRARRRSSTLGQYVAHAFALGSKTNCLFGCLLLLNLLMSATNTVLLSLLVKSVQLSELSLLASSGQRALHWNGQLGELELSLAATGANWSLSVQSVESFEQRPLVLASSGNGSHPTERRRPMLVSARPPEAEPSGRANQLAIGAAGAPAEIVANNLVWHQVTNQQLEAPAPAGERHTQQRATAASSEQARRLLELDGGRQTVALAGSCRVELFAGPASALLLRSELDAQQSELSGPLNADLDVQAQRHDDLLCESRQKLRLVSRSGRLNLAGRRALKLEAARLQLDAKRLHLAEGVEFLDAKGEHAEESPSERAAGRLGAFQLALLDAQLLAAS